MPYTYVEPEIYLEHNGVTIWHGYEFDGPFRYWFTTDETTADDFHGHGDAGWFDVRILAGRWETTPSVGEWDEYWKRRFRTEDECIEALIRTAIDSGVIPHARQKGGE